MTSSSPPTHASARIPQAASGLGRDASAPVPKGQCLVTGASGFVGSHLVEALVQRGYEVRVLLRRSSSPRWIQGLPVEFAYGDLRDKASLAGACAGIGNVFHIGATLASHSASEFFATNETGSRNLAEAFAERGDPGGFFVNCSSIAAGGPAIATASQALPVRGEGHVDIPITPYGKSKLRGERAVFEIAEASGRFRAVSLRPPVVYGPRSGGVLRVLVWVKRGLLPLVAPPGARLSFLYIGDLVSAAIQVAEREVNGVYYVADGDAHTWPDLGLIAGEVMGSTSLREVRVPEAILRLYAMGSEGMSRLTRQPPGLSRWKVQQMRQLHWVCSSKRAQSDWDFAPSVQLEEGLTEVMGWYRQHGWL